MDALTLFLAWLDNRDYRPSPYTNERNGGLATILSFCPWFKVAENEDEVRTFIKETYKTEISFLRKLPHYIEDEKHIYVHAGVDPTLSDWKHSSPKDFRWIRHKFYEVPNPFNKTVVFGHTVTAVLRGNVQNFDVWFSEGKIGIDGGTKFGGQLNALVIENGEYATFSVKVNR